MPPALACPACGASLPAAPRGLAPRCPRCGASFRSPTLAVMLSVLLPGCGHLYLGRRALGLFELALGVVLFLSAIVKLGVVFLRVVNETAVPLDLLRACIPWTLALASYSLIDGAFTWLVSGRRVVLGSTSGESS